MTMIHPQLIVHLIKYEDGGTTIATTLTWMASMARPMKRMVSAGTYGEEFTTPWRKLE